MEVDPPLELAPPSSHLLGFGTSGACEKKEPMVNLPDPLPRPQNDLFSQDISVKMASELLFKLSGKSLWKKKQGGLYVLKGALCSNSLHVFFFIVFSDCCTDTLESRGIFVVLNDGRIELFFEERSED